MMPAPITYLCVGDSLQPLPRFHNAFGAQFTDGEQYRLEEVKQRSRSSHNHYFVAVEEAWKNLPENLADRFPTDDHLRKWALIKAGYRDERTFVAGSKAEAQRLAAFIKPIDDHAVVLVREAVVIVYTAKTQKMRAMGRDEFQASKDAVLRVLAELIGVDHGDIERNAGKAA